MRCDRCGREAVHFQRYSGLRLCGEHLGASLESRAKRVIRAGGGIRPGDRIAIGFSGGPGSSSLLRFLSVHFGMRRDISLVAITVDGGGGPGGDLARVRGIAEGMGIGWAVTSPGGDPEGVARLPDDGGDARSRHTRLRDHALSSLALELGATKLALGTSLDDVAREVFLHVIRGDPARLLRDEEERRGGILFQRGPYPVQRGPYPPWTGGATSCLLPPGRSRLGPEGPQPPGTPPAPSEPGPPAGPGIPVIRPFSRIPREELLLYARLNGIDFIPEEARAAPGSLGNEAGKLLADYAGRHPSALFSVTNIGEALAGMPGHPSGGPGMERTGEAGSRPEPSPGRGGPLPSGAGDREHGHG